MSTNSFYAASGAPSTNSQGLSATMRAEFASVQAAFDLMPTLAANGLKAVRVNSGGTALEAVAVTGTGSAVFSTSPTLVTPVLGAATGTSLSVSGQLTSTVATGTAPLVVSSTTQVANLYASRAALADTVTTNANLTGVVTSSGNATSYASSTGSGAAVLATSPTLVTPTLGVATATSINGVGYTGTGGKTLTVSNSLTLAGTDGSTLNIGTGGTLGTAAYTAASAYATVAQATSALAATGGTINSVVIGAVTPAAGTFTHVVQSETDYSPALNAAVTLDWTDSAGTIFCNGNHTVTFSNVPAAGMATLFLAISNFNNITWPASVLWGVAGRPSIAGVVRVSLVTLDGGANVTAALFWQQ